MQLKMASLQALLLALFITALALNQNFVEARFSNSMYINWGAHHSSFAGNGEDLQLGLDQTSGKPIIRLAINMFLPISVFRYFLVLD